MEAKLIKVEDVYRLLREDNLIIGTTDYEYQKAFSDHCYKLSLKNCQAIERGYDLDELAYEKSWNEDSEKGFINGANAILEILGDKKFSEEDVREAIEFGMKSYHSWKNRNEDEFIQSLQQNEWDVEIVTEVIVDEGFPIYHKPKLDADGFLILKKV